MATISIEEMQRDVNGYLQRVKAGETLVITQQNKPVAEVKPVASSNTTSPVLRPFGLCAKEFVVPDDFDQPLPEEIISHFEGK